VVPGNIGDPTKHKRETSRDPKSLKINETEPQLKTKNQVFKNQSEAESASNSFLSLPPFCFVNQKPHTPQFAFYLGTKQKQSKQIN